MAETTVNIQPQAAAMPTDAFGIALAAHSLSMQTSTEMRMHREECNRRDERNEKTFEATKSSIDHVDNKLDEQTKTLADKIDTKIQEVSNEQKASNRALYLIVGGLTVVGVIAPEILKRLF